MIGTSFPKNDTHKRRFYLDRKLTKSFIAGKILTANHFHKRPAEIGAYLCDQLEINLNKNDAIRSNTASIHIEQLSRMSLQPRSVAKVDGRFASSIQVH